MNDQDMRKLMGCMGLLHVICSFTRKKLDQKRQGSRFYLIEIKPKNK